MALSPIGDTDQHPQELSDSDSIARLFRDDDSDRSFEGFPDLQARSEAVVFSADFPMRQPPFSVCVAPASGCHVICVSSSSRCTAAHAFAPTSAECGRSLPAGGHLGLLGRLLPTESSMVVRRVSSAGRSSSRLSATNPVSVHGRLGFGLGCVSGRQPAVQFVVLGLLQFFNQPPVAISGALRCPGFSPQSSGPHCCSLCRQHHGAGVSEEAGRHPISDPQLGGSCHPLFVRGPSHSAAASVYSGQTECPGGFSEPQVASPRLRVDSALKFSTSFFAIGLRRSTSSPHLRITVFRYTFRQW